MKCKTFQSRRLSELEAEINDWLTTHPRIWFPFGPQYTTCLVEDSIQYWLEHSLILFYSIPDESDPFVEEEKEETATDPGYGLGPFYSTPDKSGPFGAHEDEEEDAYLERHDQLLSMMEQRAGLL